MGVIKAWMEEHFYDFDEPEVQDALRNFFKEAVVTMSSAGTLMKKFEKKIQEEEKLQKEKVAYVKPSVENNIYKSLGEKGWQGVDVRVFAEQMTLLESRIYCAIKPKECISWNKKEKEVLAPNIR